MAFESVRAYIQLASGLSDLTRARAMEAAQGLLSMPAAGIATSTKVATQASALADEILAAAAANRSNLTALVRSEVDAAIAARLGLVPAQRLKEAQAEAARLRAEVARLQSGAPKATASKSTAKKSSAKKSSAKKAAAPRSTTKKAAPAKRAPKAVKTASPAGASRSAVTTRARPAGA